MNAAEQRESANQVARDAARRLGQVVELVAAPPPEAQAVELDAAMLCQAVIRDVQAASRTYLAAYRSRIEEERA